jgi:hypothetical protein
MPPDTVNDALPADPSTIQDDWSAVASLENRITPIVVLVGLAAINARGYWNVFTTHGATVRLAADAKCSAPPSDTNLHGCIRVRDDE